MKPENGLANLTDLIFIDFFFSLCVFPDYGLYFLPCPTL